MKPLTIILAARRDRAKQIAEDRGIDLWRWIARPEDLDVVPPVADLYLDLVTIDRHPWAATLREWWSLHLPEPAYNLPRKAAPNGRLAEPEGTTT